jgi:hypothetical protein
MVNEGDADFVAVRLDQADQLFPDAEDPVLSVFFVRVDTYEEVGRDIHFDPLRVLRERAPEMGIGADWRASELRANAEVPANPRHRYYLVATIPRRQEAVLVSYKVDKDTGR